ncbi:hypothetical protein PQQ51_02125 [Paraburkholderia xenovorans]|uniref:hypothetical protein n=1 Tax=Paraburkholderia xenovorans TaxID=36873 RepID=UPI0038BDA200
MNVSVEVSGERTRADRKRERKRASATAALMRQQCRDDSYRLLHASVGMKSGEPGSELAGISIARAKQSS